MVIWINGAFGAGKTSVAEAVCRQLPDAHLYDPEQVGYFLWENFPQEMRRKGNFQHIPIWREFNEKILGYIAQNYAGAVVVPMTIYIRQYYDEIIGRLMEQQVAVKHFILTASGQTIRNRLAQRGEEENSWAEQHIDMCLRAFAYEIPGEKIDTETLGIEAAAAVIIERSCSHAE